MATLGVQVAAGDAQIAAHHQLAQVAPHQEIAIGLGGELGQLERYLLQLHRQPLASPLLQVPPQAKAALGADAPLGSHRSRELLDIQSLKVEQHCALQVAEGLLEQAQLAMADTEEAIDDRLPQAAPNQ